MPSNNTSLAQSNASVDLQDPDSNYLLRIELNPVLWKTRDKVVTRTLSVPADCTFRRLHRALCVAFQWDDSHCWKFNVKDVIEMKTLKQRRGSEDLLEIGHYDGAPRRHRRFPRLEADTTTISTILENARYKGRVLEYIWDFGWNWDHVINVKGRRPRSEEITLVKAKGKIPPDIAPFIHPLFMECDREEIVERLAAMEASRDQEGAHTPYQWLGESEDEDGSEFDDDSQANLIRDRIAQSLVDTDAAQVQERAPVEPRQAEEISSTTSNEVRGEVGHEEEDDGIRQAEADGDRTAQRPADVDASRVPKRAHSGHQPAEDISGTTEEHQEKRPRLEAE
ncbi:hypothetical protein MBLNU457_6215t1 [Dothideomycetes sp. NU457]